MIEIKANRDTTGEAVELDINVHGPADDIIAEATAVVLGLPRRLADELPLEVFGALVDAIKLNSSELIRIEEGENNALN